MYSLAGLCYRVLVVRVPSLAGWPAGGAAGSVCTCVLPAGSDTLITGEEREVLVITAPEKPLSLSLSLQPTTITTPFCIRHKN